MDTNVEMNNNNGIKERKLDFWTFLWGAAFVSLLVIMPGQYYKIIPDLGLSNFWLIVSYLTPMIMFVISVFIIAINFVKIEKSKSQKRRNVEKWTLLVMGILVSLATLAHIEIPKSWEYKPLLLSIALSFIAGVFVKLLENEWRLATAKSWNSAFHHSIVSLGILILSLHALGSGAFRTLSDSSIITLSLEMFATACLTLASAMIFTHISSFYDRLLAE